MVAGLTPSTMMMGISEMMALLYDMYVSGEYWAAFMRRCSLRSYLELTVFL